MKNWQHLKNNHNLQQNLLIREQVIGAIREFFAGKGHREIDVPILTPALAAESHLEVFETELLSRQRKSQRAFLTTSPEIFLKKLLAGGIGNCFSITKSFRNSEDMSNLHNPEFTILEWYNVGADYKDLMEETEDLISYIHQLIHPPNKKIISYQGQKINLEPPWERLSMTEAFEKYAKMDLTKAFVYKIMQQEAERKGYQTARASWEQLFHQIFLNEIEPHLGKVKPTIIYDYPSQMAMLAKKKTDDPRFSERFEIYIGGLELGDCYSELTDWKEQEARFKKEVKETRKLGKKEYPYDKDFIEALKLGLPKCSGLAMGIDRLVMLFTDAKNIQDVLYFPATEMWP